MNIDTFVDYLSESITGIGSGYFKDIVTVHTNSIFGIKTGYFFGSRVKIIDAPILIKGEKAVRNPVENFDKTFLFLELLLKCLPVCVSELLGNKKVIALRMLSSLLFEKLTGEADGNFFKEVIKKIIPAMGLRNKPTIGFLFSVGIAEYLETIEKLPALLTFTQA